MNLEQAAKIFVELEEDESDSGSESEAESEDSDYEVDDPPFVLAEKERSSEEEPPACAQRAAGRCAQRQERRGTPSRSRSPLAQTAEPCRSSGAWRTEKAADTPPAVSSFQPRRTPGVQVEALFTPKTPKDFFLLFFATDTVRTICSNTNKNAAKNKELRKKYKWTEVETADLYKFFGLLIYMSLVSLPRVQDYWRENYMLSAFLPPKVMSRDRFRSIFWNIHLSDPEEDAQNEKKEGSPGHDGLFGVRPLYDSIVSACQTHYQPRRELTVDERMMETRAKTGMAQYVVDKPTKWGVKMFILVESSSGYAVSFSIYRGKGVALSEHGLAYDVVMNLIQSSCLGTGYHIYMDSFYTSPKLFTELASMEFGACGTYIESREGCPRERPNALTKKCERGSVRWIREGPLVFVKWMDTQEVSVCSTIHPALSGETVQRTVRDKDGRWTVRAIPCPTPIMAFKKNVGEVGLSHEPAQYYSTHRKTARWYRTMLLHFLDIATTNAFILHREMSSAKGVQPMAHTAFMMELVCQLCGVHKAAVSQSRGADHIPVPIVTVTDSKKKTSKGRLKCQRCLQVHDRRSDTPWKCQACNVALCLVVDRNCFLDWHTNNVCVILDCGKWLSLH